jgi:hypothetical protein
VKKAIWCLALVAGTALAQVSVGGGGGSSIGPASDVSVNTLSATTSVTAPSLINVYDVNAQAPAGMYFLDAKPGANAGVSFEFDTLNTRTAGSLFQVDNLGTSKMRLDYAGALEVSNGLRIVDTQSLPTCDSSLVAKEVRVTPASDEGTIHCRCLNADGLGGYAWVNTDAGGVLGTASLCPPTAPNLPLGWSGRRRITFEGRSNNGTAGYSLSLYGTSSPTMSLLGASNAVFRDSSNRLFVQSTSATVANSRAGTEMASNVTHAFGDIRGFGAVWAWGPNAQDIDTTQRSWIGLTPSSIATIDDITGVDFIGVRFSPTAGDTSIKFFTCSSGSGACTSTLTGVVPANSTRVVAQFVTTSSAVVAYLNGVRVAKHTTNIPAASTIPNHFIVTTVHKSGASGHIIYVQNGYYDIAL